MLICQLHNDHVGDKHERWPDLLGMVALAYNATIHSATVYSPHKLFYSFAPTSPPDAMVTVPLLEPTGSTNEYNLQVVQWLQEVGLLPLCKLPWASKCRE